MELNPNGESSVSVDLEVTDFPAPAGLGARLLRAFPDMREAR